MSRNAKHGRGGISAEEKKARAEREQQKRKEHIERAHIAAAIYAVKDELKTTEADQNTENDRRRFREWLTIALLTGTVIAAGFGDVIFYDTMVDAGRAWLSPIAPEFGYRPQLGEDVQVQFGEDNMGKEPAQNVMVGTLLDVIITPAHANFSHLPPVPDNLCPDIPQVSSTGVVYPANTKTQNVDSFIDDTAGNHITWSPELESGAKAIRMRGCMSYDSYGRRRHTSFCYVFHTSATRINQPGPPLEVGMGCHGGSYSD